MNGHESDSPMDEKRILDTRGLTKLFPITAGFFRREVGAIRACDDVNLHIDKGETVALVGESGSGKSTFARMVVRAIEPTAGEILMRLDDGSVVDLAKLEGEQLRRTRRNYHMIFQDPSSSLNPRMRVLDLIKEPLLYNGVARGSQANQMVREAIKRVGLQETHLRRYPHAFSGGQRQRIGIARSLVCNPDLIVCDEAVSALDVSIQAQILNLLKDIQKEMDVAYLFIAHDLAVVEHISDRVAVMYVGQIVETGDTDALMRKPLHPYTEALLSSVPIADPERTKDHVILEGEIANPANPPSGCYFHPRCKYATERCRIEHPALRTIVPGREARCHYSEELDLQGIQAEPVAAARK